MDIDFPQGSTPSLRAALERARLERAARRARPAHKASPTAPFPVAAPMRPRPLAGGAEAVPSPPDAAVIALRRLAYGPRPGDIAAFQALGSSDGERLAAWVDRQLDPQSIDDSPADARIAQSGFTTLGKPVTDLWIDHVLNYVEWDDHIQPFVETVLLTFLRAVHSERQLFEVLSEMWHDHFSVFANDFAIAPMFLHSDRDAIRPHVFGRFRDMLEAVTKTPAMLYYLDNSVSSADDPNENYAREMLELHTLGATAYYGSMAPEDVPLDGEGRPLGYTETDVIVAARCLTGWTVRDRDWDPDFGSTGEFFYYDPWHDHDPKTFLGVDLPANQPPMQDGYDLFDIVCEHPATGRFVAQKLCRRLVGDFPPQDMVDAAAAVFTAQVDAPDQLRQVVRTIVLHPSFRTTWGDKVRRPFEVAVGMLRATRGDLPFERFDPATDWFRWMYYQTGQPRFEWHPPNGYPDVKMAWTSTSPRVMTWRLANMLVQVEDDQDMPYLDLLGETPAGVRSATAIVDHWSERALGHVVEEPERTRLIEMMAQGRNPTFDLPLDTDTDTQSRLRALVALLFMAPSALWR
ncbi:MAG: DUF1800 domain-containing protein [Acidobacteriota bacterium]